MRFNFVSIPRCASQTIHSSFRTQKFMNHKSIKLFPEPNLFSFAVIREPVDRLRSWFSWHKHKYPKQKDGSMKVYQTTMLEWAEAGFPTHWTENECVIMGLTDPLSQRDYIIDNNNEIAVDYLIDYVKLNQGLKYVCKQLKMKVPVFHNMGSSARWRVDNEIIKLAKEKYKDDFELYKSLKN